MQTSISLVSVVGLWLVGILWIEVVSIVRAKSVSSGAIITPVRTQAARIMRASESVPSSYSVVSTVPK